MPHVSFDTKFDSDPLSQQCAPSCESRRRELADQPGPGVFPGGLFSSGLALLQQVLLHLAHGHLCPFMGGFSITQSTRTLLGAGVLGGGSGSGGCPPAAASPPGELHKGSGTRLLRAQAVRHAVSG